MAHSSWDRNELYATSLRSDEDGAGRNPEYSASKGEEEDNVLRRWPDLTLEGSGGEVTQLLGGVPKYGLEFYVQVHQLTVPRVWPFPLFVSSRFTLNLSPHLPVPSLSFFLVECMSV
jgi:hypothetical protein